MIRRTFLALGCILMVLVAIPFSFGSQGIHLDAAHPSTNANGEQARKRPLDPQQPKIRVEVALVSVIASVLTHDGRPAPDLPREAFELYDEGKKQSIEVFEAETQQPLDLALMIDTSMSALKELSFARDAAAGFLRAIVRPVDRVSVFQFADDVAQLSGYSNEVAAHEAALGALEPGSGTAMYDAIVLGSQGLGKRAWGRRRVIVLITDAGETTSVAKFEDARRAALAAEAMLYTIVIRAVKSESGRNTAGEHALITITDVTGGAMYIPDEVGELPAIFERIDRELRTQYRLGYYPNPRPPAGSVRKLEVRIKPPDGKSAADYIVRHRREYLVPGANE